MESTRKYFKKRRKSKMLKLRRSGTKSKLTKIRFKIMAKISRRKKKMIKMAKITKTTKKR